MRRLPSPTRRRGRIGLLALWLLLPLTACGSGGGGFSADGGVSGTGISSVTGNVTNVIGTDGNVAGIRVVVQGTDVETVTGEDGSFTLRGDFDGEVTVVFEVDDGRQARTTVDVPVGGTVDLEDVTVDPEQGEARPTRRTLTFTGVVDDVDCDGSILTVVTERDGRRTTVRVRLGDAFVHDPAGVPVPCDRVRVRDQAAVQGEILADDSIGRADVEIRRPPPATATSTPRPTPTRTDGAVRTVVARPSATPNGSDRPGPQQPSIAPTDGDRPLATATPRAIATVPPGAVDPRPGGDRRRAAR
jgi:hypothetical protein